MGGTNVTVDAANSFGSPPVAPSLAGSPTELSAAQVYRLATGTPERLALATLAALCDIFDCTPADLIETTVRAGAPAAKATTGRPSVRRPRRARILGDQQ